MSTRTNHRKKDLPCDIGSPGVAYVPKDLGQEHIGWGKLL